jgi:hypothetical protein
MALGDEQIRVVLSDRARYGIRNVKPVKMRLASSDRDFHCIRLKEGS